AGADVECCHRSGLTRRLSGVLPEANVVMLPPAPSSDAFLSSSSTAPRCAPPPSATSLPSSAAAVRCSLAASSTNSSPRSASNARLRRAPPANDRAQNSTHYSLPCARWLGRAPSPKRSSASSSLADYDHAAAYRWATILIPNPPADSTSLGATALS